MPCGALNARGSVKKMLSNYQDYQILLSAGHLIVTIWLFLYARKIAKTKDNDARFDALKKTIGELEDKTDSGLDDLKTRIAADCRQHEGRTIALEKTTAEFRVELGAIPTQGQFSQLSNSIMSLNGELKRAQGRLEGINRAVDLINEYLINKDRKG